MNDYYLYLTPFGAKWMHAAWPVSWIPREWKRVMDPRDDSKPFRINAWWAMRIVAEPSARKLVGRVCVFGRACQPALNGKCAACSMYEA
jgi:hypothetical protein